MIDIEQVKSAVKEAEQNIRDLVTKQDAEIKKAGETSTATAKALADAEKKYDQLIADANEQVKSIEAKLGRLSVAGQPGQVKSFAREFTESDEFKAFQAKGGTAKLEVKALTTALASAGALVAPQRLTEIVRPGNLGGHVRDLLTVGRTSSSSIEYARETVFANLATVVEEGALKPESNLTFEQVVAQVATIAHWLPVSKQARADAAMLESYLEGRLVEGLLTVEDREILYGAGTAGHLHGIVPQASIYVRGQAGDTIIDTLRRARTQVRLAEYEADGAVMNPVLIEQVELAKGSDGHYIWTSGMVDGVSRIWRMPLVEVPAMGDGEFLVGAFKMGAGLFVREDATVSVSDSDRDNFVRNMLTVLAEMREALAVFRPDAFVHGDLTESPA